MPILAAGSRPGGQFCGRIGVAPRPCHTADMAPRFLTLTDVTEILNVSPQQARALVVSGDLPAIQVGGRHVWRVEATELEKYIERMYAETRARTGRGVRDSGSDD